MHICPAEVAAITQLIQCIQYLPHVLRRFVAFLRRGK